MINITRLAMEGRGRWASLLFDTCAVTQLIYIYVSPVIQTLSRSQSEVFCSVLDLTVGSQIRI